MAFRVRVAGLLVHDGQILLVKHRGQAFWLLPGGRLDEGESLHECVAREFLEETGIKVRPQGPVFLGDFLSGKKHIVDVIFRVSLQNSTNGIPRVRVGSDAGLADASWFPVQTAPEIGPPPLGDLLKKTEFVPEKFWHGFHYGGSY
jgi:8-oxo-dGTP diphosphatase